MKSRILVVDDEPAICKALVTALVDEGYILEMASDGEEALKALSHFQPDVVLLDVWMPGDIDGIDVLKKAGNLYDDINFIVMSGHGNIETAVKATKLGAWDFIEKPLSIDKIVILIENVLSYQKEKKDKEAFLNRLRSDLSIVGGSKSIVRIKEQTGLLSNGDSPVFLMGERGVGKLLVAQNLHYLSYRAAYPFVFFDAANTAKELLWKQLEECFSNSTLVSLEGTSSLKEGTVFIRHIDFLPKDIQEKLLKSFKTSSNRIIVSSELNSPNEIKKKILPEFWDYFDKNIIPIPPLRLRTEDITALVDHFSRFISNERAYRLKSFSDESLEMLLSYPWQGNVLELKNFIERLYILISHSTLYPEHLVRSGLEVRKKKRADTGMRAKEI